MNKIFLKDYIGWGVAILCAFIAAGFFVQKEHLKTSNEELIKEKIEIQYNAKTIQQYTITNNYNLPEQIKINLDKIITVSGDVNNP